VEGWKNLEMWNLNELDHVPKRPKRIKRDQKGAVWICLETIRYLEVGQKEK
jgi:hypothetical protein